MKWNDASDHSTFLDMKICFISRFDSFVQLAKNYAMLFRQFNWEVEFVILNKENLSHKLYKAVTTELRENDIRLIEYSKDIFLKSDVVFFSLTGGFIKKIFKRNCQIFLNKNRPYLIASYPGIVYQNIIDGFCSRSICDLIIFPSFKELNEYQKFCTTYGLKNVGIVGGYFKKTNYDGNKFENDFIFAEQTVAPNTFNDRIYLAKMLLRLAKSNPNRLVYIKPRTTLIGDSLFKTKLHIIDAIRIACKNNIPKNIIFTFKPIEFFTSQGAMCLTISSTAAIETLQFHTKIAFITDFGPAENNGSDYFCDSGVQYKFSELLIGRKKEINSAWKKSVYVVANHCFSNIREKIISDLTNKRKLGIDNTAKLFAIEYLSEPFCKKRLSTILFIYIRNIILKLKNIL